MSFVTSPHQALMGQFFHTCTIAIALYIPLHFHRVEVGRLRDLLSDREHELASLRAQLMVNSRASALGANLSFTSDPATINRSETGNQGRAATGTGGDLASKGKPSGKGGSGRWPDPHHPPTTSAMTPAPPGTSSSASAPTPSAVLRLIKELQDELAQREFQARQMQEKTAMLEVQLAVSQQTSARGGLFYTTGIIQ